MKTEQEKSLAQQHVGAVNPFIARLQGLSASAIFQEILANLTAPDGFQFAEQTGSSWFKNGNQVEFDDKFLVKYDGDEAGSEEDGIGSLHMQFDLEKGKIKYMELNLMDYQYDIIIDDVLIESDLLEHVFGPLVR